VGSGGIGGGQGGIGGGLGGIGDDLPGPKDDSFVVFTPPETECRPTTSPFPSRPRSPVMAGQWLAITPEVSVDRTGTVSTSRTCAARDDGHNRPPARQLPILDRRVWRLGVSDMPGHNAG